MPPNAKTRLLAYAGAWIVALVVTAPSAVQLLPFFPAGLFLAFTKPTGGAAGLAVFGWLLYGVHAAVLFLTSSRTLYFAVYAILIVMLLTNVVGCHKVLRELSNIH